MLVFKQLTLENFGPYFGKQKLIFPSKKGVIIIRGKNGRGKTTIMNALRFVLFGSVKLSGRKNIDLVQYLNIISKTKGNFRYKVILDIELDGKSYEITRLLSPKPGLLCPETINDYQFPEALIKETTESGEQKVLIDSEVKRILNQIMDEHVARFYLFDGELLKEYESQLMGEQDVGAAKIKEGIENILGVPILKNACEQIDVCLDQYSRNFELIIQSNKETEKLGIAITTANTKRESCKIDVQELNSDLSEIRNELSQIQNKLENSILNQEAIKEQAKLQKDIENFNKKIEEKKEQRISELRSTWKGLLSPILQAKKGEINSEIKNSNQIISEREKREKYIEELKTSLNNNRCKLCNQLLDTEASLNLKEQLDKCDCDDLSDSDLKITKDLLLTLQNQSKYIDDFTKDNSTEKICIIESEIREIQTKLLFAKKDLEDTNQEVESMSLSLSEYQSLIDQRDLLKKKEKSSTDGLEKTQKTIKEIEENVKKLEIQLNHVSNDGEVENAKRQRDFVTQLRDLVQNGISQYQNDLKKRVEIDATSLFIKLSDEKEYNKLKINENYGLEIIHKDGEVIPLRSSGYEHLVAFSLIGALHKNAPLQGPLFMDTSFGRLDQENSQNLIRVLPELSEQVILLVHDREIDEERIRGLIPSAIKAKYQIERVSSRESKLKLIEDNV